MFRFHLSFWAAFIAIAALACSSHQDPTSPSVTGNPAPRSGLCTATSALHATTMLGASRCFPEMPFLQREDGHRVLGILRVRVWDDGTVEVIPRRTEQAHFDITSIILNCPTCFSIELGPPPGPNMFDFYVTLTNPTGITAYDVTGIIRASGDIKFLNPDSYTFLFAHPGDTTPNPYAAWNTGIGKREFPGHGSFTEMLRFERGGLTKFYEMDYVFQASYPTNQEEPYGIWGLSATDVLQSDGSNSVDLRCRVGDWQENVDTVTVDLTPIGGSPSVGMTYFEENIWRLLGVSYSPTGQGVGDHGLRVTATSNGVSTCNYLPVTVVQSGPIKQGPFKITHQNLPLEAPDGPTDGMDIAVMGATDGTHVGMVFAGDDTYHFWSSDYKDGTFGLYSADSGEPITPFDMPNFRFDFADKVIPDTSGDSLFTLNWGEVNTSPDTLDPTTIPPVMADQRIALWFLDEGSLKLTANVLVIGSDPGPPQTFDVIVRPAEIASGFRNDGLLYVALVFDAGDEMQFPIVDVMAFHPPLDFVGNPDLIKDGYEISLPEGSGPNIVNREALVAIDVDDSQIMEIVSGYAGHAWVAACEGGAEQCLEIIDADIDAGDADFITVPLSAAPLDCEILPLTEAGQPSNWICVLCADNVIRLYDYSGTHVQSIGGPPYMIGAALRLDVDDENLAIHVLHQGPTSPLVTVYKWDG